MRYRAYSTRPARVVVANLVRDAHRALDGIDLGSPRLDPDSVRGTLETFLDDLAGAPSTTALTCQDCDAPVPDYRVRRWYHPTDDQVFDVLCRSCAATREDVEAEARAFHALA